VNRPILLAGIVLLLVVALVAGAWLSQPADGPTLGGPIGEHLEQ
jgi:hypothetical protein